MMKHGIILISFILLLPAICRQGEVSAQIYDKDGQYVDTVFHDHINRQAEDFVTVSLCVADPTDWRDDFTGVMGHAWLRLQCKTFNLDYCFSYETKEEEGELVHLLRNDMLMGLFALPTKKYIKTYQKWHRTVHEYMLNLPPDVEQRLWEIMDEQASEGGELSHDMVKRGCTLSIVHFVEQALDGKEIQYTWWPEEFQKKRYEMILDEMQPYPWIQLMSEFTSDNRFKDNCPNEEKLIFPHHLAEVWSKATLDGRKLLQYKGDLVKAKPVVIEKTVVTPLIVSLAFFLLTIVFLFTKWPYWDWIIIGLQAILGVLICSVLLESAFGTAEAALLAIVFNPIPALVWQWRKKWMVWYGIVVALWIAVVNIIPALHVNMAFSILAITILMTYLKEPIKHRIK